MHRRVRSEPSLRLRELALAADTVRARGLVPRHRDVHEPLEEVTLGLRGRPPGDLELLVCLEVRAVTDQLDASLVAHRAILAVRGRAATFAAW